MLQKATLFFRWSFILNRLHGIWILASWLRPGFDNIEMQLSLIVDCLSATACHLDLQSHQEHFND